MFRKLKAETSFKLYPFLPNSSRSDFSQNSKSVTVLVANCMVFRFSEQHRTCNIIGWLQIISFSNCVNYRISVREYVFYVFSDFKK